MNKLRRYPGKLFWRIYLLCLAGSFILDFYLLYDGILHYHFPFQYLPQFFALFGFFGCMLLILIAKGMGIFIVAEEDYYERKQGGHLE